MALSVLSVVGYMATGDSSNHLVVLAGFVPLGATRLVLARLLTDTRQTEERRPAATAA